jgi:hypothetical protein
MTILDVIKGPNKLKPGDTLMSFYSWNSEFKKQMIQDINNITWDK